MASEKPLIDFSYLAHICQHDQTFMREMIQVFIDSLPEYASELRSAFEQDQTDLIGKTAHKLKPLLLYLKLEPLYTQIKELQNLSKEERLKGEGFEKLEATFTTVQAVLEELQVFMGYKS